MNVVIEIIMKTVNPTNAERMETIGTTIDMRMMSVT